MTKELKITCIHCGNNKFEIIVREDENLYLHIDTPCTVCSQQPLDGSLCLTFEDTIGKLIKEKE